jgi:hypothetical protein
MKSKIERITRWTPQHYGVKLTCGHYRTVTPAELDQEQLFIGKPVACQECAQLKEVSE